MKYLLLKLHLIYFYVLPIILEAPFLQAISFLNTNSPVISLIISAHDLPQAEVLSIISPELIRYNLLRDFFETKTLELTYAEAGSTAVDFSIGYFQMKVSFIEKLEEELTKDGQIIKGFELLIPDSELNDISKRRERVKRLKTLEGQLHYACAFYAISRKRFACIDFDSDAERLRFFASAYNFGFDKNIESIKEWSRIKAFPFGKNYEGPQIEYGSLALHFCNYINQ